MRCPRCGSENPSDNKFCQSCGASLSSETEQPKAQGANTSSNGVPDIPSDPESGYTVRIIRRKRSKSMQAVSAVIRVLLYVGLLFGCQSCVISGYTMNQMLAYGLPATVETIPENYLIHLLEDMNENMTLILLISNLLVILLLCVLFRLRQKNPREEMGVYPVNPLRLPLFALFGTALNLFWSMLLTLLPLPESLLALQEMQYSGLLGGNPVLEIFSVGVVAGIAEELIFRGIAMTRLEPIGAAFAVFTSGLIFAMSHGTPIAMLYAFSIGLLFAGLFHRYGSVIPGIACHIFFNIANYWMPEESSPLQLPLLALSVLILIPCVWLLYIRRPSFLDAVNDEHDRMPIGEEERALVRRFREVQKNEGADRYVLTWYKEEWKRLGKK